VSTTSLPFAENDGSAVDQRSPGTTMRSCACSVTASSPTSFWPCGPVSLLPNPICWSSADHAGPLSDWLSSGVPSYVGATPSLSITHTAPFWTYAIFVPSCEIAGCEARPLNVSWSSPFAALYFQMFVSVPVAR
jgi:hypothetical protein